MLRRALERTTNNWALKLTALALAFLLWTTVRADAQWTPDDIPVRVVNHDGDWVIGDVMPPTISVTFRGPYRELLRTAADRPDVVVTIDEVNDSIEIAELRPNWVRMPAGTEGVVIAGFNPRTVRVGFDKVSTRLIPLAVQLRGEPALGFEIVGAPEIEPSVVRASGAGRNLGRVDTLRLPAIDLSDRRTRDTVEVTIDTTGTGLIISPRTVRIIVPVRPILSDTTRRR